MKFKVPMNEMQSLLQKVMPAIPPKATLPILEHLHFSAEHGKLRAIATDQDITIIVTINVETEHEGSVLVPGRRFEQIIKLQDPSAILEFTVDVENLDIKLFTGTGKYIIKGLNVDEYLDIPELFKAEKPDIEKLISGNFKAGAKAIFSKEEAKFLSSKTVFAVSEDEYRPAMTGVLFQFRNEYVKAVATDSYRLVIAKSGESESQYPDNLDIILPKRTVELLKKIDERIEITTLETNDRITHIRFDVDNTIFISKIIDERFPPYETVIPLENKYYLQVSQKELIKAINRVSIQANTFSKHVKLSISKNQLVVSGRDEDMGTTGDETISCEFNGDTFETGFNFKFLLEAVQNIEIDEKSDDIITIMFSEPIKPVLIKSNPASDDLVMLLMPVRIN